MKIVAISTIDPRVCTI